MIPGPAEIRLVAHLVQERPKADAFARVESHLPWFLVDGTLGKQDPGQLEHHALGQNTLVSS
jgi:hypothetical protein